MFWTYEFQGAQHMISTHKPEISQSHKNKSQVQEHWTLIEHSHEVSLHQQ